jgi:hypothetical protein
MVILFSVKDVDAVNLCEVRKKSISFNIEYEHFVTPFLVGTRRTTGFRVYVLSSETGSSRPYLQSRELGQAS